MLEDNYNDIIQKARQGTGLSVRATADQLNMKVSEIINIEKGLLKFNADLVRILGLNYRKLEAIYNNQYPVMVKEKINLNNLDFKNFKIKVGGLSVNTYIVSNLQHKQSLLIDAIGASKKALDYLKNTKLNPQALLITHGHFDHRAGVEQIKQNYPKCKIIEAGKDINQDGPVRVPGFNVQAFKTPGHTQDAVCYLVDNQLLFSGDTLFAGSVGRPNFNYDQLLKNITEKIFTLTEEIVIAPGHGPLTTIKNEKENNPFFKSK